MSLFIYVAIKSLCAIEILPRFVEYMWGTNLVEMLLQLFISQINAELLKTAWKRLASFTDNINP